MIRGTDRWIWKCSIKLGESSWWTFIPFQTPVSNPEKPSNHTTVISPTGVANLVGQRSYLCWKRLGDLAGGNKSTGSSSKLAAWTPAAFNWSATASRKLHFMKWRRCDQVTFFHLRKFLHHFFRGFFNWPSPPLRLQTYLRSQRNQTKGGFFARASLSFAAFLW